MQSQQTQAMMPLASQAPLYSERSFWAAAVLAGLGTFILLLQLGTSGNMDSKWQATQPAIRPVVQPLVSVARPITPQSGMSHRSSVALQAGAEAGNDDLKYLLYMKGEEFETIVGGSKPVLVDFSATWCGPCKLMEPKVAAVAKQYDGKLLVYKMDCEAYGDKCVELGITALPTIQVWKSGELLDQMTGTNMAKFDELVQTALR